MEWPSGLRRRFQYAPSPVRTSVTGGTSLRADICLGRETAIPGPSMADTYGCPNQKILPKQTHTCKQIYTVPSPKVPQAMILVIEALTLIKKKCIK